MDLRVADVSETATEQRIYSWAQWSVAGGPARALGYKSPSLTLLRQHMGGGVPLPPIGDDEALFVDAVVCRLRERRGDLFLALTLYYGVHSDKSCVGSFAAVGRFIGSHKHHAQQLVSAAVAWVDGQFDHAEQLALEDAA